MHVSTSLPQDVTPDPDMLVHPVYLAGRGDTTAIYDPLCETRGWGKAVTANGLMFTSPRQDTHIAYLPESRYGGWKAIPCREPLGSPLWRASFSRNTPAEITSAFTTALAEGLPNQYRDFLSGGARYQPGGPTGVLVDRGWQTDDTAMYLYQRSPDGHAYFGLRKSHLDYDAELQGEGPAQWTMYGCVDRVNGERWHADFTSGTPLYLVREAALALSSTAPVERPLSGIPERNLPYVTALPVAEDLEPRLAAALARTPSAQQTRLPVSAVPAAPAGPIAVPARRR